MCECRLFPFITQAYTYKEVLVVVSTGQKRATELIFYPILNLSYIEFILQKVILLVRQKIEIIDVVLLERQNLIGRGQ